MQMFEKLQELPLLMGLSKSELMEIVERYEFDFKKHKEGAVLATQGERTNRIVYVLAGTLTAERHEPQQGFCLTETIDTVPLLLEPHNLWGLRQQYARTYLLETEGATCSISKRQLSALISSFEVVKTNVLSLVCNRMQMVETGLMAPWPSTTEARILRFVRDRALTPSGRKQLRMKMQTLADLIQEGRLSVSKVLNGWQERGLLEMRRGVVDFFDLGMLMNH